MATEKEGESQADAEVEVSNEEEKTQQARKDAGFEKDNFTPFTYFNNSMIIVFLLLHDI